MILIFDHSIEQLKSLYDPKIYQPLNELQIINYIVVHSKKISYFDAQLHDKMNILVIKERKKIQIVIIFNVEKNV